MNIGKSVRLFSLLRHHHLLERDGNDTTAIRCIYHAT